MLIRIAILSSAYCATCMFVGFFYNAFARSCIRIVNKIGAITDPCGMPISIFFKDEHVFPNSEFHDYGVEVRR